MEKQKLFNFHIWNPIECIFISFQMKFRNSDYSSTNYILFAFIFFQFDIDFNYFVDKYKKGKL